MDIKDFLLARITEDEALARDSYYEGQSWLPEEEAVVAGDLDLDLVFMMDRKRDAQHAAHWSPSRVLAECAAKRAIIGPVAEEGATQWEIWSRTRKRTIPADQMDQAVHGTGPSLDTLRALAAVYSDHPDYRQEWAA